MLCQADGDVGLDLPDAGYACFCRRCGMRIRDAKREAVAVCRACGIFKGSDDQRIDVAIAATRARQFRIDGVPTHLSIRFDGSIPGAAGETGRAPA